MEDPMEIAYDRGWTDGLPIVPPTALETQGSRVPAPEGRLPRTRACANQSRQTSAQFAGTGAMNEAIEPPPACIGGVKLAMKARGSTRSSEVPDDGRPKSKPRSTAKEKSLKKKAKRSPEEEVKAPSTTEEEVKAPSTPKRSFAQTTEATESTPVQKYPYDASASPSASLQTQSPARSERWTPRRRMSTSTKEATSPLPELPRSFFSVALEMTRDST